MANPIFTAVCFTMLGPSLFIGRSIGSTPKEGKNEIAWPAMPQKIYSSLSIVGQRESKNQPAVNDECRICYGYREETAVAVRDRMGRCLLVWFNTNRVEHGSLRSMP